MHALEEEEEEEEGVQGVMEAGVCVGGGVCTSKFTQQKG